MNVYPAVNVCLSFCEKAINTFKRKMSEINQDSKTVSKVLIHIVLIILLNTHCVENVSPVQSGRLD